MPAIQLARLKIQVAGLVDRFDQPVPFHRALRDLYGYYADRTYRPGLSAPRIPLIPHYRLPTPVVRQVEIDLLPSILADPLAALALVDELWLDPFLEPRLLAVYIFSHVSPSPPEPVIERLIRWARPEEERQVITALLSQGTARLQREQPELWAGIIQQWLRADDPAILSFGLHALISMISDPGFENLPGIFRLLSPIMLPASSKLQGDLVELIGALAQRWPIETAVFLRQMISMGHGTGILRVVRRCLGFFPMDSQASLRDAMQVYGERQKEGTPRT